MPSPPELPPGASSPSRSQPLRPILLNLHGGAWRGGEARISPQSPIWQTLAAQGAEVGRAAFVGESTTLRF